MSLFQIWSLYYCLLRFNAWIFWLFPYFITGCQVRVLVNNSSWLILMLLCYITIGFLSEFIYLLFIFSNMFQDDILPKLMTSTGSYEDLFRKEISKYDHICEEIAQNIEAQEQLLLQIQVFFLLNHSLPFISVSTSVLFWDYIMVYNKLWPMHVNLIDFIWTIIMHFYPF